KGSMTIPPQGGDPAFDPIAHGARVMILDSTKTAIIDATMPPGAYSATAKAGWKANGAHTAFAYVNAGNPTPFIQGIKKFGLKASRKGAGLIKFSVSGKNGSYDPDGIATHLPLVGTIIIDVPNATTGLCGESKFPGPPNPLSTCSAVSGGNTVR